MKKLLIVSAIALFATPVFAQQQAESGANVPFMQHAIVSLQTQRNSALDNQAAAEARAAGIQEELNRANVRIKELGGLQDDLAKANAKIKELEAKIPPPEEDSSDKK